MLAIAAITSGVLTVITNWATGKPWDQDLLANILLVGVFASIAGLLGRREGLVQRPGE